MNGQDQNLQLTVNVEILGHICAYCDGRVNLRLQDCCDGWVCPTPFFNVVSSHRNLGRVVNMQTINKPSEMMFTVFPQHLATKLQRPIQVLGWYHSHPHITVWPSHVGRYTWRIV